MILLDGQKLSKKILENIKNEIKKKQLKLKLAVVLVGKSEVSKSYINKKKEACDFVGVEFKLLNFSPDIPEEELKKEIIKLANDKNINGIVIQLPLSPKLNTHDILNLIPEKKDPDILSDISFQKFEDGKLGILPPVVGAIKYLLEEYKISLKNKKIVLVGKGKLVGKPVSAWLESKKADFLIIDKNTKDITKTIEQADIIISGAGSSDLIKRDMIKQGAVLIDAGSSSEEGIVRGDIEKNAYKKASYVAPVPGGVGPLTIVCLLKNLIFLANSS